MPASPLQAIRLAVLNLAAARHFWEAAFGFEYVSETEVEDPALRRLWDTEGGVMRVARLEYRAVPGFPRLELYQWEGCSGEPIRSAKRPWDLGVRELRIPVPESNGSRLQSHLERLQCRFLDDHVFVNPFGERCRIGSPPPVALTVPSLDHARTYFSNNLGWSCAASVAEGAEQLMFSPNGRRGVEQIEVTSHRRIADPREPVDTSTRMSPRFTGVWMLTTSVDALPSGDPRIVDCDVPFVGRTRAIVDRAPGGVRFGMFEKL